MAFALLVLAPPTDAQDRNKQRTDVNDSAIFISAGHPDSTMMKIADDISIVLDGAGGDFRVVPVVGDGAEGNVRDLVLLRNIDVAITDLVALEKMKQSADFSKGLYREVAHILTLFPDKIQILARSTIKDVKELAGKRVSVGLADSGSALHADAIFKALGVGVVPVNMAMPDSAEALVNGEIDAFVCFCLASPGVYQRLMFNVDIHVLPIPFADDLQNAYLPATIVHDEFPAFIPSDTTVETLAVPLALITYNWPKGNPRYARVAEFVKRLFDNMPRFQQPPRHRGWRSVQISASLPGWPRFVAAEEWQNSQRAQALQQMRVAFNDFLSRWTTESAPARPSEQIKLFEEFLQWRQSAR